MELYKRLIRSREVRLRILRMLSWVPDDMMLKIQYRIKTGRKLSLKDPRRYTEKVQWYKINWRDPVMVPCVDKYDVRQFVKNRGLEHILNECYGIYEDPEEVDFAKLPDSFVLKDTLGSGGDSIIVVEDKKMMDEAEVRRRLRNWCDTPANIPDGGREWPYYSGKKHRIVAERYISADKERGGLVDYKFHCFDGKPVLLYVIADRTLGNGAGFGFYDMDYNRLPYRRTDERELTRVIEKPENYEELVRVAKKLAEGFPHVRVDLYDQDNQIIFGELTFFDASGYTVFEPDEVDFILGEQFKLPEPVLKGK